MRLFFHLMTRVLTPEKRNARTNVSNLCLYSISMCDFIMLWLFPCYFISLVCPLGLTCLGLCLTGK